MTKKLVSIIIPVYNAEKFLDNCILSIRNQTYSGIEIILINDGSNDRSLSICMNHAEKDRRIIVIDQENKGVSAARNAGINKSLGEYILFVDSDDYIETNMIEILINFQKEKTVDIIMFGFYIDSVGTGKIVASNFSNNTYYGEKEIHSVLPSLIKKELINSPWNKLYSRNIIRNNNIKFDETINIGEDLLFNYHVFNNITSLRIVDNNLYHYVVRGNDSLTSKLNTNKYKMLRNVNEYMEKSFQSETNYNEVIEAIKTIQIKNTYSCLLDLFHKNNKMNYYEKRQFIRNIINEIENTDYIKLNSFKYKILVFILKTRNITFIYVFTYFISIIRKNKHLN